MKKDKESDKDELRPEYKRADFPGGLVRGKYAKRLKESSNIVGLRLAISLRSIASRGYAERSATDNIMAFRFFVFGGRNVFPRRGRFQDR
jgi:hypothetical protein